MYSYYWAGMHTYWWFFWFILWVLFFSFLIPVRRSRWISYRQAQTPLELLQHRLASGQITTEDYEARRAVLLRDAKTL
jgi:putative membrane protein